MPFFSLSITCQKLFTGEPRFNEPLRNKILGIPSPSNGDMDMENNFHCDGTLLQRTIIILSDPWPFVSLYQGSTATVLKINLLTNIQYLKMLAFL